MPRKSSRSTGLTSQTSGTSKLFLLPTPTAGHAKAGARSRSGKRIGEPLLGAIAAYGSISSPEDSLASRYLLPAGVKLNVIRAGSGLISLESFAFFDRDTCSWRTSQDFLWQGTEDLASSLTLPKWGTMRNGRLFQRQPLVRPISGKGFSLLPTPASCKAANDTTLMCSSDARKRPNKLGWVAGLTATAHKRGYSGQAEKSLLCPSHAGGPINPEWLEHLMGFPIGWTELEESATPSSPKSPSGSAEE